MSPQLAIWLCAVLAVLAVAAVWFILEARASLRERPRGRHARAFADPADAADPDGSVWLRSLRHAELPAAGPLPMLPPDPPPASTRPQAAIKDVAACELGMTVQDYVDGVFAPAEASLNAMAARYAEVTG